MTVLRSTPRWAVLFAMVFSAACGPDPETATVSRGAPAEYTEPPALQALRARQLLQYTDSSLPDGQRAVTLAYNPVPVLSISQAGVVTPTDGSPYVRYPDPAGLYGQTAASTSGFEDFLSTLRRECTVRWRDRYRPDLAATAVDSVCSTSATSNRCDEMLCTAEVGVCMQNLMLEIASSPSPVVIAKRAANGSKVGDLTIPVQSRATKAALREEVARLNLLDVWTRTLLAFYVQLSPTTATQLVSSCAVSASDEISKAAHLTTAWQELHHVGLEAARSASDDYVALGDAEMSRYADIQEGSKAARVIRTHGAQLLSGGLVSDVPSHASCTVPSLSSGGQRALAILRQVALPPARILDTSLTIENLIAGTGSELTVKYRYGRLVRDATRFDALSTAAFYAEVGVRQVDFDEARRYLQDELKAFGRSATAGVPSALIPDVASGGDAKVYVGTARAPMAPPWAHFSGLARHVPPPGIVPGPRALPTTDGGVGTAYQNESVPVHLLTPSVSSITLWHDNFSRAMDAVMAVSGVSNSVAGLNDAVNRFKQTLQSDYRGLAVVSRSRDGSLLQVTVASDVPSADLILVRGTDAVRCAVEGTIEGDACTFVGGVNPVTADTDSVGAAASTQAARQTLDIGGPGLVIQRADGGIQPQGSTPVGLGFLFGLYDLRVSYGRTWKIQPGNVDDRLYVLRRRAGATAGQPGSYEPFVSAWLWDKTTNAGYPTAGYYDVIPITPDSDREAAGILTPSREWCTMPRVTCAGTDFDGRLPLEDELVEDGSVYENSWYSYLNRARAAAERADALGEAALAAGFDIDERSESAKQDVEDLCGVNLNLDPIAAATNGGVTNPLAALPSNTQLEACIGPESTVPYVSLGTTDLCAWEYQGQLCGTPSGATVGLACPRAAKSSERVIDSGDDPTNPRGHCEVPGNDTATYRPVLVTNHLGFFQPPPGGTQSTEDVPDPGTCAAVRQLRTQVEASAPDATQIVNLWKQVFQTDAFFDPRNVSGVGAGIRWEAAPGGYSTLYVGDLPVFSTGSLWQGASNAGICNPAAANDAVRCPAGAEGSLFCTHVDCTNSDTRAQVNARLAAAATVARWLAQRDLQGFVVPDRENVPSQSSRSDFEYYQLEAMTGQARIRVGTFTTEGGKGGANPARYYCADPAGTTGDGSALWYWLGDLVAGGYSATASPVSCNDSKAIRFTVLDDSHRWGQTTVSESARNANSLRAVSFLDRLRSNEPMLPVGGEGLLQLLGNPLNRLLYRGYSAGVGISTSSVPTVCPACTTAVNETNLAWYIGNGSRTVPTDITDQYGVGYYAVAPNEIGRRQLFDALEVLCEARQGQALANLLDPSMVSNMDGAKVVATQLDQAAQLVRRGGELTILRGMPRSVVDSIVSGQSGMTSQQAGQFGASVSEIRAGLAEMPVLTASIESSLAAMARALRLYDAELRKVDATQQVERINLLSTRWRESTACTTAVAGVFKDAGVRWWKTVAAAASASATCVNMAAQLRFANQRYDQEKRINQADRDIAAVQFEEAMAASQNAMRNAQAGLEATSNRLQSAQTQLEVQRARGQRALSRALFLDADTTGTVFRSNTVLRRRLNTAQVRYDRARQEAIQYAFLAKRAIEQRFGVRLADLNQQMTLVPAPSTWESTLCSLEGIDYAKIRDASTASQDYAGGYIGDYVELLSQFVESYRLDYPFVNGASTAVVSLRDDVQNVRDYCPVTVGNRLYYSNDLTQPLDQNQHGWTGFGCDQAGGTNLPNCYKVERLDDAASSPVKTDPSQVAPAQAVALQSAPLGTPRAFRVVFGPTYPGCPGSSCMCGSDSDCGFNSNVTFGQEVDVTPGYHRMSFYTRTVATDSNGYPLRAMVNVRLQDGSTVGWSSSNGVMLTADNQWRRYSYVFYVSQAQRVRVFVPPPVAGQGAKADLAGLMFESIGFAPPSAGITAVPPFAATDGALQAMMQVCEDTDGSQFRARGWQRSCVKLCPDGYGTRCTDSQARTECFWETQFTINETAIDRGEILTRAGFARGNFNYRIERFGVNFVGSAARTCQDEALPSTCYSAGFIPYTLEHVGPYPVRNHFGQDYQASLFTGIVEHAQGLATERYLTNPISSSDRALMDQYMVGTFRGRPISGTYVLRVWEAPGVNFSGIEDVQILLDYRYWTRSR